MSWPSIWQTQNQPPQAAGAQTPAVNPAMYQMTPEQQYALQQQNWQQWQIYQAQLAQWTAQYGEQYQQMQNKIQNVLPNAFMPNVAAPPLPDYQPPPPPPPQQQQPQQQIVQQPITQPQIAQQFVPAPQNIATAQNLSQPPPQVQTDHQTSNSLQPNDTMQTNQSQLSSTTSAQNKNVNFEQPSHSQYNQDGFRRNNRNNRWNHNNTNNNINSNNNAYNNNNRNRMFGGNNFGNRNVFDRDEQMMDDAPQDRRMNDALQDRRVDDAPQDRRMNDALQDRRVDDAPQDRRMNDAPQDRRVDDAPQIRRMNDAPQDNEHDKEEKSQEEMAFDIQFRKWEDQFIDWKRNNANHPDQNQYNDFVIKMEGCRQKLLQRRETLKQKRLDAIRESQGLKAPQGSQPDPQNEMPSKNLSQQNFTSNHPPNDFEREKISSSLFSSDRCDEDAGIPGLDLVSGGDAPQSNAPQPIALQPVAPKPTALQPVAPKPIAIQPIAPQPVAIQRTVPQPAVLQPDAPKPDSNLFAQVNNILGNPQIQSLLSNIQKQNETAPVQQNNDGNLTENNARYGSNSFNRFGNETNRFENYRNNEASQRNPFRPNNRDDFEAPQQNANQFVENPKRGRYWNENSANERQPMDHFNRDRSNFGAQQATNQDMGVGGFKNDRKRPRESNTFANSSTDFSMPPIDFDEFRPIQVIDYQNKTQKNRPPFGGQSSFSGPSFSNMLRSEEIFPRKIIEYEHKSKVHPWNWFCPVVQIDYNHTRVGLSLHEYPPPKPIKKEPEQPPRVKQEPKVEKMQARESKWAPGERQERYPYGGQSERYHQSRFEHRPTAPFSSQPPNDNQPYLRSNVQERNWSRNQRDWNAPTANYGYERSMESRNAMSNMPPRSETDTLPNTSSSSRRSAAAAKQEPNPKYNLKHLLFLPGRRTRPKKIVILMRGIPGSGKSWVSKMIKDKEQENGGSARILSIDDYFMTDNDTDAEQLSYEYDPKMEDTYTQYLLKSFKKNLTDNLYDCIIVDCNNTTLQYLTEFYTIARTHQFTPFVCEMPLDLEKCLRNNIHNRTEHDIRRAINEWVPTPSAYTVLEYQCLFSHREGETEEISDIEIDQDENEDSLDAISDEENANAQRYMDDEFSDTGGDEEPMNEFGLLKSKWDNDTTVNKLARLDGTNKPIKHTTIEDYLQMDGWEPPPTSSNGKKRVRWADIEQKREQDKQRAIGFIVGHTDWKNLVDQPRDHSNALTAVKYIEKVRKN